MISEMFSKEPLESDEYLRVKGFQARAGQATPDKPEAPTPEVAVFRAKIMLEEMLETIEALGVAVWTSDGEHVTMSNLEFEASGNVDLTEVADGCADTLYVTLGTLVSCGVPDKPLIKLVWDNNDSKFEKDTSVVDGKLIKAADHQPPPIAEYIEWLRAGEVN